MPAGNTRHTYVFQPRPFYVQSAQGCKITDVDGNERFDFLNNMGVLILGNNHPKVVEAVKKAVDCGIGFAAPTELEIQLAEMICQAAPCAEKVRFTVTGTEATMTAVRALRAYSRRSLIAKFEGHYHGTHDYAQVSTRPAPKKAGKATSPTAVPDSEGIPSAILRTMLVLPWNDFNACESLIRRNKRKLAAVMLDPIANASGLIPPKDDFLSALRECTEDNDVLLHFDEVLSGFRLAYGGAQEYYDVVPDLATYGKIIGGGFPVGAIAGKDEIMQAFAPSRTGKPMISHLGTYNGHPVTMAAGIATLNQLNADMYHRLNNYALTIKMEIERTLEEIGIIGHVTVAGSFMYLIHFGLKSMTNVRDRFREDKLLTSQFGLGSICDGIYLLPAHSCNLSAAFTNDDITRSIDIMKGVLHKMKPLLKAPA
jgi:glutamate-1-semialdehyde 2,1-aminomutase